MVMPPLKKVCTPMFTTSSLVAVYWPFVVRNHYLRILVVVVARIVGAFCVVFLGCCFGQYVKPVESPLGALYFSVIILGDVQKSKAIYFHVRLIAPCK